MMFNNLKNLIGEIVQTAKDIDVKNLYHKTIDKTKHGFIELKHKVSNLFKTNLQNGLSHYYAGHYKDALIRFKLMDNMWKNNAIVHYNLGKVYFAQEKKEKAKAMFETTFELSPSDSLKKNVEFFLKKLNNTEELGFVPEKIKEEFYDYSISSLVSEYSIHENHLKKVFDLYNRYIGALAIKKGEANLSVLDIGSHVGLFSKFCRQNYSKAWIQGVDLSSKMVEFSSALEIHSDTIKTTVYNSVLQAEMHKFLYENYKRLNGLHINNSEESIKNTDLQSEELIDKDKDEKLEEEAKLKDYELSDNNIEKLEFDPKYFDIITAIGTFADFGDLSVILKLCEYNLNSEGILIFLVPEANNHGVQFSKYQDCFYYSEEYIKSITESETKLKIIEIIHHSIIKSDNKQLLVILRKD
jgi:predicted TPR repeat methyltransferase